jgi:murein DD-endopeptidase MepM/ murein hydrolase activator NlpD
MLNAITRTDARILQQFGVWPEKYAQFGLPGHDGLDLEVPTGHQLYAPVDGTIAWCRSDPAGWGLNLALDFFPNRRVVLCHLMNFQASHEGDEVVAGTPICLSGMTGNTNWPHVHVTLLDERDVWNTPYNGRIDPYPWLKKLPL